MTILNAAPTGLPLRIVLSASENGVANAPWRLVRLLQTLGVFADLLAREDRQADVHTVAGLHDHEGRLVATYTRPVNARVRGLMTEAWHQQHEATIEHVVAPEWRA